MDDPAGRVGGGAQNQRRQPVNRKPPIGLQKRTNFAASQHLGHEVFMAGNASQPHVFNRMAVRPVADVMNEGSYEEGGGIVGVDLLAEPLVSLQTAEKVDRQPKHAQRMFQSRMDRPRVDKRDQS